MSRSRMVAFVCLHGSAKSLIAAEYLSRMAVERGVKVRGTASGHEPDPVIPPEVIVGLLGRGIDVRGRSPVPVTANELARADHIVSFECDLGQFVPAGRRVERWDDCPMVSDDFGIANGTSSPRRSNG